VIDIDPRAVERKLDVRRLIAAGADQFSQRPEPAQRQRSFALFATSTPFGAFGKPAGIFPVRANASNRIGAAAVRPIRPGTGAPSGRPEPRRRS